MQSSTKGALLLLPNLLGALDDHRPFLPASVDGAVERLDGLIAESDRAGRRFLSRFQTKHPVQQMPIACFPRSPKREDLVFLLEPVREGECWGVLSDAGLPCVADPGAQLVQLARSQGVAIEAFSGPSAVMHALVLSGLPGQRFHFNGYLPREEKERGEEIVACEKRSKKEKATQIFIETPYRNDYLLAAFLEKLSEHTTLAVAWDLTLPTEGVVCQTVRSWKRCSLPALKKRNATFLFCA